MMKKSGGQKKKPVIGHIVNNAVAKMKERD